MPFTCTWVPGGAAGTALCIVGENHNTWVSLLRAARASAARHAGVHVGYGAGQQFCSAVLAASLLEPGVEAIAYFGDLDDKGLAVPAIAAAAAAGAGLPAVVPAHGLYRRLLASGPRQSGRPPLNRQKAEERAAWLGPLSEAAIALLVGGVRLAQEHIGTRALLGTAPQTWL